MSSEGDEVDESSVLEVLTTDAMENEALDFFEVQQLWLHYWAGAGQSLNLLLVFEVPRL